MAQRSIDLSELAELDDSIEEEDVSRKLGSRSSIPDDIEEEDVHHVDFGTASRSETPTEVSFEGKNYRKTFRPNQKEDKLIENDLWNNFSFFFDNPTATNLLQLAASEDYVEGFNQENGTDYVPIDASFKNKKLAAKQLPKAVFIARILGLKTARMIALDYLQRRVFKKNREPVFPLDYDISQAFIQFVENGPIFPGDVEDSEELAKAAGIRHFKPKNQHRQNTTFRYVAKAPVEEKKPNSLFKVLNDAIAKGHGSDEPDEERTRLIYKLLDRMADLDDDELRSFVSHI